MKIHRLIEIVQILLNKKHITAKELAIHFEVSKRTIYRDLDILSQAGIPFYTDRGKNGGISLIEGYYMDRSLLSNNEQTDILSSLNTLKSIDDKNINSIINKLNSIFQKDIIDWIEVDFSNWGSSDEQDKFNLIKRAIINRNIINFDYYNSFGEKINRNLESIKIIYKHNAWYVYGFCLIKKDFRLFKISRIKNIDILEEKFKKREDNTHKFQEEKVIHITKIKLKISKEMSYRVYDEFDDKNIIKNKDGNFTVEMNYPENEWLYGYILSFGEYAKVIAPERIKLIIKEKLEKNIKNYL